MKTHELKTWVGLFGGVVSGRKPFEVRKDDRGYEVGDTLILKEYDPNTAEYTGAEATFEVTYVLHGGQWGVEAGNVVMGLSRALVVRSTHDGSECADFSVEFSTLEAERDKLHNRVCELSSENRELTNEVLVGLADTAKLTQEIQALKKRDSVLAYEKLGAENLVLLGRVRELEAALFAANEEIDDLRIELNDTRSAEQCIYDECD